MGVLGNLGIRVLGNWGTGFDSPISDFPNSQVPQHPNSQIQNYDNMGNV